MKLFSKTNCGSKRYYNILGIKFSRPRKLPSQMSIKRRTKKLQTIFRKKVGYDFNPQNPRTFNEKIQWLKLFYHNPLLHKIVDKLEFKQYITNILGDEYVVPLLGAYTNPKDIDFNQLPEKFVLKSNVQSDGKFIKIIEKNKLNKAELLKELDSWLDPKNTLVTSFCWGYYGITPKIIAEQYIDLKRYSTEYKVFCFNGKADFVLVELDYFGKDPKRAFYSRRYTNLDFKIGKMPKVSLKNKPTNFKRMISIADKLATPFPFVRVDFYDINGKLYVGELTFYSGGGYSYFYPSKWDKKIGDKIKLSKNYLKGEKNV